jgi:hypothetical protein
MDEQQEKADDSSVSVSVSMYQHDNYAKVCADADSNTNVGAENGIGSDNNDDQMEDTLEALLPSLMDMNMNMDIDGPELLRAAATPTGACCAAEQKQPPQQQPQQEEGASTSTPASASPTPKPAASTANDNENDETEITETTAGACPEEKDKNENDGTHVNAGDNNKENNSNSNTKTGCDDGNNISDDVAVNDDMNKNDNDNGSPKAVVTSCTTTTSIDGAATLVTALASTPTTHIAPESHIDKGGNSSTSSNIQSSTRDATQDKGEMASNNMNSDNEKNENKNKNKNGRDKAVNAATIIAITKNKTQAEASPENHDIEDNDVHGPAPATIPVIPELWTPEMVSKLKELTKQQVQRRLCQPKVATALVTLAAAKSKSTDETNNISFADFQSMVEQVLVELDNDKDDEDGDDDSDSDSDNELEELVDWADIAKAFSSKTIKTKDVCFVATVLNLEDTVLKQIWEERQTLQIQTLNGTPTICVGKTNRNSSSSSNNVPKKASTCIADNMIAQTPRRSQEAAPAHQVPSPPYATRTTIGTHGHHFQQPHYPTAAPAYVDRYRVAIAPPPTDTRTTGSRMANRPPPQPRHEYEHAYVHDHEYEYDYEYEYSSFRDEYDFEHEYEYGPPRDYGDNHNNHNSSYPPRSDTVTRNRPRPTHHDEDNNARGRGRGYSQYGQGRRPQGPPTYPAYHDQGADGRRDRERDSIDNNKHHMPMHMSMPPMRPSRAHEHEQQRSIIEMRMAHRQADGGSSSSHLHLHQNQNHGTIASTSESAVERSRRMLLNHPHHSHMAARVASSIASATTAIAAAAVDLAGEPSTSPLPPRLTTRQKIEHNRRRQRQLLNITLLRSTLARKAAASFLVHVHNGGGGDANVVRVDDSWTVRDIQFLYRKVYEQQQRQEQEKHQQQQQEEEDGSDTEQPSQNNNNNKNRKRKRQKRKTTTTATTTTTERVGLHSLDHRNWQRVCQALVKEHKKKQTQTQHASTSTVPAPARTADIARNVFSLLLQYLTNAPSQGGVLPDRIGPYADTGNGDGAGSSYNCSSGEEDGDEESNSNNPITPHKKKKQKMSNQPQRDNTTTTAGTTMIDLSTVDDTEQSLPPGPAVGHVGRRGKKQNTTLLHNPHPTGTPTTPSRTRTDTSNMVHSSIVLTKKLLAAFAQQCFTQTQSDDSEESTSRSTLLLSELLGFYFTNDDPEDMHRNMATLTFHTDLISPQMWTRIMEQNVPKWIEEEEEEGDLASLCLADLSPDKLREIFFKSLDNINMDLQQQQQHASNTNGKHKISTVSVNAAPWQEWEVGLLLRGFLSQWHDRKSKKTFWNCCVEAPLDGWDWPGLSQSRLSNGNVNQKHDSHTRSAREMWLKIRSDPNLLQFLSHIRQYCRCRLSAEEVNSDNNNNDEDEDDGEKEHEHENEETNDEEETSSPTLALAQAVAVEGQPLSQPPLKRKQHQTQTETQTQGSKDVGPRQRRRPRDRCKFRIGNETYQPWTALELGILMRVVLRCGVSRQWQTDVWFQCMNALQLRVEQRKDVEAGEDQHENEHALESSFLKKRERCKGEVMRKVYDSMWLLNEDDTHGSQNPFSHNDTCVIFEQLLQHGKDWVRISEHLPGRSAAHIERYFQEYKFPASSSDSRSTATGSTHCRTMTMQFPRVISARRSSTSNENGNEPPMNDVHEVEAENNNDNNESNSDCDWTVAEHAILLRDLDPNKPKRVWDRACRNLSGRSAQDVEAYVMGDQFTLIPKVSDVTHFGVYDKARPLRSLLKSNGGSNDQTQATTTTSHGVGNDSGQQEPPQSRNSSSCWSREETETLMHQVLVKGRNAWGVIAAEITSSFPYSHFSAEEVRQRFYSFQITERLKEEVDEVEVTVMARAASPRSNVTNNVDANEGGGGNEVQEQDELDEFLDSQLLELQAGTGTADAAAATSYANISNTNNNTLNTRNDNDNARCCLEAQWNEEEMTELMCAYHQHGRKWKTLQRGLPHRTVNQIKVKLEELLQWTVEEDNALIRAHAAHIIQHGGKTNAQCWTTTLASASSSSTASSNSKNLQLLCRNGRGGEDLSKRYNELRNEYLKRQREKSVAGRWTKDERVRIMTLILQIGFDWPAIETHFPGRKQSHIKTCYYRTQVCDNQGFAPPQNEDDPWSVIEEGIVVREVVKQNYDKNLDWNAIHKLLPGRTLQGLQHQYENGGLKEKMPQKQFVNVPWSDTEMDTLFGMYLRYGNDFEHIQQEALSHRTLEAVTSMFRFFKFYEDDSGNGSGARAKPMRITTSASKVGAQWSILEEGVLMREYARHGPDWATIAASLPGRGTGDSWERLLKAKFERLEKDFARDGNRSMTTPIAGGRGRGRWGTPLQHLHKNDPNHKLFEHNVLHPRYNKT